MSRDTTTPTDIGPTSDGTRLRILWQDDHESVYEPRDIRLRCPCAGCIDEMTGKPILQPAQVAPDIYPTAIHYVGRYGLQFVWSDGHDTGIYTFELLRMMSE